MRSRITRSALAMPSLAVMASLFVLGPALAASGNGYGQGGVNGGNSAGGKSSASASANAGGKGNASANASSDQGNGNAGARSQNDLGIAANSLGKLNGFFNASPMALRQAAPDSSIGKISVVYAGLLQSYLASLGSTDPATAGPSLAELAKALADATNKPLSPEIVAAINQRLFDTNTDLGTLVTGATNPSNPTPLNLQDLAGSIAAEADGLAASTVTSIY